MSRMWLRDYKRRWAKLVRLARCWKSLLVTGAVMDEGEIDDELEVMEQEEKGEGREGG